MTRLILGLVIGVLMAPAAARAQSDEVIYYHTDAIGSVRMITDATGAVVGRYDYLPFGELWPTTPALPPDVRQYAGKERDAETGLDYFGARYYRGVSGRFTTVDPALDIQSALVNPQGWNRYSYALNNPLKFTDPDGRNVLLIGGGIGAAVYTAWTAYMNVQQGRPWYDNIGVEAGKGFVLGATLGLAAPALAAADLGAAAGSAAVAASSQVGAAREIAAAQLVGGRLAGEPGIGMSVTVRGLGTTGVDVLGAAGEYIGIGGPAKGLNPADFGRKLQILKAAAEQAGVKAQYGFQTGTPRWIIDFAKKRLGEKNVFEFELR
ncbi:MAG: RHS repeat-associated core domain-containing protein [Vicinamibacterales bacterium]